MSDVLPTASNYENIRSCLQFTVDHIMINLVNTFHHFVEFWLDLFLKYF